MRHDARKQLAELGVLADDFAQIASEKGVFVRVVVVVGIKVPAVDCVQTLFEHLLNAALAAHQVGGDKAFGSHGRCHRREVEGRHRFGKHGSAIFKSGKRVLRRIEGINGVFKRLGGDRERFNHSETPVRQDLRAGASRR